MPICLLVHAITGRVGIHANASAQSPFGLSIASRLRTAIRHRRRYQGRKLDLSRPVFRKVSVKQDGSLGLVEHELGEVIDVLDTL